MSKKFGVHTPDQMLILPPSLKDWLPANHLVYFIHDVVEGLDIREIDLSYQSLRGYPPYEPRLMLRILFYAYCTGVYSSRQIARRLQEDVAFRILAGNSQPDFRTICKSRKRHQAAIKGLFLQILKLCAIAGLVRCGHVALDGTKLKASASKHKAMSYGWMVEEEERLQKEIEAMLAEAERTDKAEQNRKGDDLPAELAFREKRLAKIREAKAALEAAARERDGLPEPAATEVSGPEDPDDPPKGGKKRKRQPGQPEAKSQRNFTDPDSRIMRGSDKQFIQGYNAQAVVDPDSQIIVAADVTNQAADAPHAVPMFKQAQENLDDRFAGALADAGYFSAPNVVELEGERLDVLIPPRKIRHSEWRQPPEPEPLPEDPTVRQRMQAKLQAADGRAAYALRMKTVEPVFGQIKGARGFQQFHLRGLPSVKAEWFLVCLAHNLLKVFRSGKVA